MHDLFYDLKTIRSGTIYAGSDNHRDIEVWDINGPRCLGVLRNAFEGGSERIAVTPDGKRCFTGCWEGGVSCFDVGSGRQLWHREDILGVQHVRYSTSIPGSVFLGAETEDYRIDEPDTFDGIMELDAADGSEIWRYTSADKIFVLDDLLILVDQREGERIIRFFDPAKQELACFPMMHNAVLSADYFDGVVALAERDEGVRLIAKDGSMLAHYRHPKRDCHCIDVCFVQDAGRVCVVDNDPEVGGGVSVTALDGEGAFASEYFRDYWGNADFLKRGSVYLDSRGNIFNAIDGREISEETFE